IRKRGSPRTSYFLLHFLLRTLGSRCCPSRRLQFFLLRVVPLLVVGLALDRHEAAHPEVTEAAQLRAGDLVLADAVRDEPHRDSECSTRIAPRRRGRRPLRSRPGTP